MHNIPRPFSRRAALALLCALALAACAPSQPKPPDPQETLRNLESTGYPQAQHLEISTQREKLDQWR